MVLPFEPKKPLNQDPRFMIVFGAPKTGKTSICGSLPNSLLIDLEATSQDDEDGGSWHIECVSLKATNLKDLGQIIKAIKDYKKENGKDPYDIITLDHASKLEDIAEEYALQLYNATPQGRSYTGKMSEMGQGFGYRWIREAYIKILDMFREIAKHIILVGHTKFIGRPRNGEEIQAATVDLTGRLGEIVTGIADAVGYVYRKDKETILSFSPNENLICGARSEHLRNKELVVATSNDEGEIKWDMRQIYTHIK
jgi:hypothetical protein